MVFSSSIFLFCFLPIVLVFYYSFHKIGRGYQNILLTLASLAFYAWGEPIFVLIMISSIIVNWFLGLQIGRHAETKHIQRIYVVVAMTVNISILFVFKYLSFIVNSFAHHEVLDIALPIGISFFTFQSMSYILDIQRERGQALANPLDVGLYISFFPQLIAGPIVRYETIASQIKDRRETFNDFADGIERFMIGFIKKVLIANNIATIADLAFGNEVPTLLFSWAGAIAYTLQIYYDFSGYSDMAIGLGKMFGFHFNENFNYPYISSSISEFWRRWHISLGTWFRDYVYFPLGGSRVKSKYRLVFNLFVVWTLTGIWHGANWTFLIWGIMYFFLITLEKLTGFLKKSGLLGNIYTMLFVIIGWVVFRSISLEQAWMYICSMFGASPSGMFSEADVFWLKNTVFFYVIGILFAFPIAKKIPHAIQVSGIIIGFILSISYMIKGSYNPFIYYNF
jgi:alginate O-acetyltransferase complex protein AlgI